MEKSNNLIIKFVILAMFMLSSCYQPMEDIDDSENTGTSIKESDSEKEMVKLKVVTKASQKDELTNPITVLVFDKDGICKAQTELINANSFLFNLPTGTYTITAVAGLELDSINNVSDCISMPAAHNCSSESWMMGQAQVTLRDQITQVNIQLSYRVAKVQFDLKSVPSDIESITISVLDLYSACSYEGSYTTPITATIEAEMIDGTATGNVWSTGVYYVYPSAKDNTVLNISMKNTRSETIVYAYSLNGAIESGIPYQMTGTYTGLENDETFAIEGTLSAQGWSALQVIDFDFGPGISGQEGSISNQQFVVEEFPLSGSVWNGHIVAMCESETADEASALLFSVKEAKDVYSAFASECSSDALNCADSYSESGLSGWQIPSTDQIRALKKLYGSNFSIYLNDMLDSLGGDLVVEYDENAKAVRYLCEQAMSTYSFKDGSSILSAGSTVKYRLRYVKPVSFVKGMSK